MTQNYTDYRKCLVTVSAKTTMLSLKEKNGAYFHRKHNYPGPGAYYPDLNFQLPKEFHSEKDLSIPVIADYGISPSKFCRVKSVGQYNFNVQTKSTTSQVVCAAMQKRKAIDIGKANRYSQIDTVVKQEQFKPSCDSYNIKSTMGSARRCSLFSRRNLDEVVMPVSDY